VSIGRVVFGALNKFEWAFFLILVATWFFNRPSNLVTILILAIGIILAIETIFVLPVLDTNAALIIRGLSPKADNMHLYYVLLEFAKAPVLFLIGWKSVYRQLLFN